MPKFIVKPGQKVTHGDQKAAVEHYSKMPAGTPFAAFPPAPIEEYSEGDELELTEEQAAAMPHAVCTPAEFDELCSPRALQARGYTRDEAESMSAGIKANRDARGKKRTQKNDERSAVWGMQPTGDKEPNPINAGKLPEDGKNKSQK